MPQDELTCRFIADAGLLSGIVDGVNEVATGECVVEFHEDRLRIGVKDPANVMMSEQIVDADAFEHYGVSRDFRFGLNTAKLEDLLGVASSGSVVEFDLEWERRKFHVRFEDVEYELSGIDTSSINGVLEDMPARDDPDFNYNVRATVPTDGLDRGAKIVGLASHSDGVAKFRMGTDDGIFEIGGEGDTDASKVKVHESDDFGWVEDPPSGLQTVMLEGGYLSTVPGLVDTDTFYFETGEDLPAFFECDRCDGRIDSTFGIAPRLDKSK